MSSDNTANNMCGNAVSLFRTWFVPNLFLVRTEELPILTIFIFTLTTKYHSLSLRPTHNPWLFTVLLYVKCLLPAVYAFNVLFLKKTKD